MALWHVIAIAVGSSGLTWAVRELFRSDRAGHEVQGHYGRWTRLPGVHDDLPF